MTGLNQEDTIFLLVILASVFLGIMAAVLSISYVVKNAKKNRWNDGIEDSGK